MEGSKIEGHSFSFAKVAQICLNDGSRLLQGTISTLRDHQCYIFHDWILFKFSSSLMFYSI